MHGIEGYFLFTVEIHLTIRGLHASPGLGMAVIKRLFDYIGMLKSNGPQEWRWMEMKSLREQSFRYFLAFQDKSA